MALRILLVSMTRIRITRDVQSIVRQKYQVVLETNRRPDTEVMISDINTINYTSEFGSLGQIRNVSTVFQWEFQGKVTELF
jgi:hypothetical protein